MPPTSLIPSELWTYIVLYFSIIILGNAVALSAFLLAFLGGLGPSGLLFVIITVTLADLGGDSLWFTLGKTLHGTKVGNFIKNHLPNHDLIYKHIHEDSLKWLYLSKFISSITAPFLFLLGWSQNVSFKKFFEANVKTTVFWVVILLVATVIIGSGLLPFASAKFFRHLEVMGGTIVVLVIALQFLLKYLTKKPAIKNFFKKITSVLMNNNDPNHPN